MERHLPVVAPLSSAMVVVCLVTLAAQTPPPAQTPVFRGQTNIFRIDVSVHDKNRRHVPGLTASDFSVMENGTPRKVVAVSEVEVRPPAPVTAPWLRDVASDVTTNSIENRRVIVLAIEAVSMLGKRAAHAIVDAMGPDDIMAVVFVARTAGAQDFTTDRASLHAAIDRNPPPIVGDFCGTNSLRAEIQLLEYLADVPDRRKVVFLMATGRSLDFVPARDRGDLWGCQSHSLHLFAELMRVAQISNANFYPIDITGLKPFTVAQVRPGQSQSRPDLQVEYLQVLAENTGGHAIVKNNRPDLEVPKLLEEAASYYMVGYEMAPRLNDGELYRRINVKVDRPGVEVVARTRYYEPPVKNADADALPPLLADVALRGILPDRGMPAQATLTPFPSSDGGDKAAVSVVLGLERSGAEGDGPSALDVVIHAFDHHGNSLGRSTFSPVVPVARGAAPQRYELASNIELPPGKYEVRASVHDKGTGRTGSVYASVDVPDFARAPLSMSGVLVDARPAWPLVPLTPQGGLNRSTTTTRREFATTDRVAMALRVYQGGKKTASPIAMSARIVDDHDRQVFTLNQTLAADVFDARRSADYRLVMPLATLAPGAYLLSIEAKLDAKNVVRRDVRFAIK